MRAALLLASISLLAASCGEVAGDSGVASTSSTVSSESPTTTLNVVACLHPDETPYRSRWSEQAEGFHTEVRREIAGDEGQWIFEDLLGDTSTRANVVVDGVSRIMGGDGVWEELPAVPIRFPLLVWVNGYVTGSGVARVLEPGERSEVAGIPVTRYEGGIEEMTKAFPGKMRGREFEPSSRYRYWVDECGALLKADVTVELGGEEREIAIDIDLPTTYRYEYEVYDVGASFLLEPPTPGYVPDIPGPTT